ncbi:MAG: TolC family protein [Candidatus Saelkia tenebricola]|nr:TolC family protein [Candidatus Saelkia tenebricola]
MKINNKTIAAIILPLILIGTIFTLSKHNNAFSMNQITNILDEKKTHFEENDNTIRSISLDEASKLALKNSLDIQIAKFDLYRKRTSLSETESIFDTFLNTEASYKNNGKKTSTTFLDTHTITNLYSIGLEKKFPTGSTLEIELEDTRVSSNLSTAALKPYHEATAGISITQSLGKNFFGLADRGEVKITQIDIINSEYTSLNTIENILYNTQKAYWNLVLKNETLKIKLKMLKESQKLLNIYKEHYERGVVESVDLLAAQANVGSRKNDLLLSELEKEIAKNNLLFLLNEIDTSVDIIPHDSLTITPHNVDTYKELKEALLYRRDYKIIENQLKSLNIDIAVKKNALWPEIDMKASFAKNGIRSELQNSWKNISNENNSELYLGISFKIPIENRLSKSELKETELHKEQLLISFKRTERLILKEIHNKTQEINNLKERVSLLNAIKELQKNKLAEEMKRLNYGRSNSDTVIRYEDDLLQASLNLAKTLFDYRINIIELNVIKNTLLNKYWNDKL